MNQVSSLSYCGSVPEFDNAGKISMREKAARSQGPNYEAHGTMSDEWVADRVRMLSSGDIDHEAICCAARDRIMRLVLRVAALEGGYLDAIVDIGSWAGYASEYFQEKHDLEGTLNDHRKILGLESAKPGDA